MAYNYNYSVLSGTGASSMPVGWGVTKDNSPAMSVSSGAAKSSGGGLTLTQAGLGLSLAGNLMSAFNSFSATRMSASSYKRQAEDVLSEAATQVEFIRLNNELTQQAYAQDRIELLRMQRAERGSARVAYSSEGIEATGSMRVVLATQAGRQAEDLQTLDLNAQREAFRSQLSAEHTMLSANYKARMLRLQAKYAKKAANLNLMSGITSALGSFAFGWGMTV